MGCSGPAFGLALDTRNNEDIVYEEGGQIFIMEPNFFEQFGDFKVEYTQRGYLVEPVNKDVLGPSDCGTCSGCN
jgi:Fe-S cluster assembly iron-binding protein IscA